MRPASTSFSAACCSPIELITLARRSRSASACLAMARTMVSLRSISLISTVVTTVCRSRALLDVGVKFVPLREHLVQFVLAEHRAQRGLCELAGRGHEIADLDDRAFGIDDTEVKNGVDLDRDVVARDHVLRRHDLYHHPE